METTTLVDGRFFCEGPRWHDDRFWFSDFYAHEICSVGLDGDVRVEAGVEGTCPEGLPRVTGVESIPVPVLTDD